MTGRWSSSREAAYRDQVALTWQLPVAFALAGLAITALGLTPAAIPALYLAAVTPELVRIDLREHRLPNRIVVPGIGMGLAAAAISWAVSGIAPVVPLVAALAAAGLLFLLALGGGIGMGDIKLAAVIGLASPTIAIAWAAPLAAFLLGGVVASIVLLRGVLAGRGRETRGAQLAFGPYLLLGYFAALAVVVLWAL